MNSHSTPAKKAHLSFLRKIKFWHVLVSILTLGALAALFILMFKLGSRTSPADIQDADGGLVESDRGSSASRPTSPRPRGIPKATAEAVNRIIDVAASKSEIQARSKIDDFRENWTKAAKGDFSNVDPEFRAVVEKGEKSADMIIEEQAKNELKQTLSTSKSSIAQVQKALDNYHAVAKHLNVKEFKIAAIGDPTKAENLCEVRLRELTRMVKSGTSVSQKIIDEAVSLLRSPGEFMSLGLAGRLNIVDNIKKTPEETLQIFNDVDLASYNDMYEAHNASDMYGLSKLSKPRTDFPFSGSNYLWTDFKKDSRIEDIREVLESSVAADPNVVQKFIHACSKLEYVVPPHFLLEQLDSEPEILSRFIERYLIYGFNLKRETWRARYGDLPNDKNMLLQAEKTNKKRMGQALKLRDAIHLKMTPSINDREITESSEWKKFVDNPKDRTVFKNLLKKLESLGLGAAAMKDIALDMRLQIQTTEISKTTPEYNNVCAIHALCDLFGREVSSEEKKYFDIMKKHYFDMKRSEALDAFYQILRLNSSSIFKLWKEQGNFIASYSFREDNNILSHDIFKLIALVINASFEQESAISALVLVATLEEIIAQSSELSVPFRNLPDKLIEAIKEANVPHQFLRDFHAAIIADDSKGYNFQLSPFYSEIIKFLSPNSFLALDYNMHRENKNIIEKFGGETLNREYLLECAKTEQDKMMFGMYFGDSKYESIGFIRRAALAQKAYEDKNFSLGVPSYIKRIDIDDMNFATAVQNQILVPLDDDVFKQTNPSPYVLARKQLLEGALDEVYNNPASSINTVEKLFEYLIEDPFIKQFDDCVTLNKGYNLNMNACGLSLLDTKLTGSVLETAGISSYDSMVAYLHFMALKHAKTILSDRAMREKLITAFIEGKQAFVERKHPEWERVRLPLKHALNAFMQQAHMGNEKKMTLEERAVHEQVYKPIQDSPEAYKKQLSEDLVLAEENLKKVFKFYMRKLAFKFLFPPTLQIGSIYVSGPQTGFYSEVIFN